MKAINLIMQCYKEKFEMIKSEPELVNHKETYEKFWHL